MAINFAAANMEGYNNPEVKIIPVTIKADAVINPPQALNNKSTGEIPCFLFPQYSPSGGGRREYRR